MGGELLAANADDLMARAPDGATVAVIKDECGVAMEAARALIRRGATGLRLVLVPYGGMQTDMLVGAGCVKSIEGGAVSLGEMGPAPRFTAAVKSGAVVMRDATCPAMYAGLQAAEKGVPFLPLRGIIGSDVEAQRGDFKVIENPFAEDDPILAVPAIRPDVALIHAPLADTSGNVWIGRERAMMTMAHAARETLATVEEITDADLLADEKLAPGVIPNLYISGVAVAEKGSWPLGVPGRYGADRKHLETYAEMAKTDDGFQEYLDRFVLKGRAAAE